jgi:phosphoribosylanthranilate isomerase
VRDAAGVRVKICGLCRPEDARVAEEAGAEYLGVVFAPGPRRQDPEAALRIFDGRAAARVGVFADEAPDALCAVAEACGLAVVQLHGSEPPEACARVRGRAGVEVWKAVRVRPGLDLASVVAAYAGAVDAVLVEGYSARGLGGTGTPLPVNAVAAARGSWPAGVRMVVAGGLTPENVAEVVRRLRPDVVDASSGVEARVGTKDAARVRAFVRAARAAAEALR